ncbi:DUF4124 domain-containing protein [Pseudomonas sp. CDFA 602]|uniref:DUF4124 domain-containing protein n=1 Tax=Pseudomonas californiensis TaxID=2829823 RepID=UPI001E543B9A|nr:DUF4124 domain-containing protein [Pseudomonas californiensis]MCD5996320.1 DUF4124 domain-containing protein [Pseudomonas californiensis]MCD6001919.1 DUF4124 domain-containing protein [Pseudomonas californiensis]
MHWMIFAAALAMTASATAQAATVYKWVDAQGVTHFDAQPPADKQSQQINMQKQPVGSTPASPVEPAATGDAQQRDIDRKVREQVKADEANRAKNCQTLRTNLAQLQLNPRVREQVEGETRRLTDENRKTRIEETERAITEFCR